MTAEDAKAALADLNKYQGWTAEMYRSTKKTSKLKSMKAIESIKIT